MIIFSIICETQFSSVDRTGSTRIWWHNQTDFAIGPLMHVTQDGPAKPTDFVETRWPEQF